MAVKASSTITLSFMVDVKATYRYYKLQPSTEPAPEVPTTDIPEGWTSVEPAYAEGSTNTLYFVDKTVFTNDTFSYSLVSVSSSYEAAKVAYNKAVDAGNAANDAKESVDNKVGDLRDDISSDMDQISSDVAEIGSTVGDIQESQKDLLPITTFEEYKTSVEATSTEVNASFAADIEKLREDLTTEVESRSALIRMAMENLGDEDEAGVEVGVSGSELSSMFTNKRLVFLRNKVPIITMSADNEMLEIKSVEIKEELQLGGFQWSSRSNGNMGLAWIRGDE